MNKYLLLSFSCIATFFSCRNEKTGQEQTPPPLKTEIKASIQEIYDVHDIAHANIAPAAKIQAALKKADSTSIIIQELETADSLMFAWMGELRPAIDSIKAGHDGIAQREINEINHINTLLKTAIKNGEIHLSEISTGL